jgi:large conductance mechanosensitive channel
MIIRYINKLDKMKTDLKDEITIDKHGKITKKKNKKGEVKEEPKEPETKICPYCLTEIKYKAVRCPHCTSELDKVEVEKNAEENQPAEI